MLKYKTKPIELPKAVDEIWSVLEMQDETIQILMQQIQFLTKRLLQLEREQTSDEAKTRRLH